MRGTERPQVSTPFTWKEAEGFWKREQREKFFPSPDEVLARVEKHGDLFGPVLELKQRLGAL
jgi:bifunctional non-homologous end joining protein LigD